MKNPIINLTHTTFKCRQYEKTAAFYRDILELKNVFTLRNKDGSPDIGYFKIADKEFIELLNQKYEGENKLLSQQFVSLIVEDIYEAARSMESKGVVLYREPDINCAYDVPYLDCLKPDRTNSYAFFVRDPEGNFVEIKQYTKVSLEVLTDHL